MREYEWMSEEIQGAIERITFYNEDNGYSVLKIKPQQSYPRAQARDGTVTVVGVVPEPKEGETVQFSGEWVNDPRYGLQFRARQAIPVTPATEAGIIDYLSSAVRGIGPKTAEKIVDYLGSETIAILDAEPQRVRGVPGLTAAVADRLIEAWSKDRVMRNTLIYLQGLGISAKIAQRIYKEYGTQTRAIIESNPYQLADDVFLIGFKKADQIARNMGVQADDRYRLRAGLGYALNELTREGHTYAPAAELLDKAAALLGVDDGMSLNAALQGQLMAGKLMEDSLHLQGQSEPIRAIYLPRFFYAETAVTRKLRGIADSSSKIVNSHRETKWRQFLKELSQQNDVDLSQQQQGAVRAALTGKLSVLTGGPGTGKTTTLQMVIHALHRGRYKFALASPTGRAAKRLSEATGEAASTIHRLLGYSAERGGFEYDEEHPLPVDMVVIDEASMLDLLLFHSLLKALKPTAHLLLVGDADQLPSVGAGNVLRDVIDSGLASVTRLDQIFRQDDDSYIVRNAHRINQGQQPYTANDSRDFYFFEISDPESVAAMVVDIVKRRVPQRWDFDPVRDIQVIAPMYRGAAGVSNLNARLQSELNGSMRLADVKIGGRVFRVGDKVMQTRNNYEKDVFNGDIGFIDSIDGDDNSLTMVMDGVYVDYDFSEMDDLMHAYCISTHRSQGSEYPVVVMPVMTQHYMMLQRNLLYTAITRAKQLVVLVGTRRALWLAVDNNKVAERHSGLLQRLKRQVRLSRVRQRIRRNRPQPE